MTNKLFNSVFIIGASALIVLSLIFSSCQKENIFDTDPSLKLNFSSDSISFDTIFTTVGSITRQLKVYNPSNKSIKISSINLTNGNDSFFKINIDGTATTGLNNIELAAKDSLYIFVKVTIDPNDENSPFVIDDQIIFHLNGNTQDVDLVAWGQNANYIIADTYVQGLPPYKIVAHEFSDTTWTSDKPFLVYGYAVVDSNAILRINAGTKIYFHNNSGLWIYKGGAIKVNGELNSEVIFQGDRLEEFYSEIPGQWDRIWINEGSIENEFSYAVIKNGFIGIQAETLQENMGNQLTLNNTIIKNMSGIGILSRFYNITGRNSVIANCGNYCAAFTMGGNYYFIHTTIANFWTRSVRQTPALFLNNYYINNEGQTQAIDINITFGNSIIYGNIDEEIQYDEDEGALFNYVFDHCDLKTELDISNTTSYLNCLKNEDPLFVDYLINNYMPDSLSPVRNIGSITIAETVVEDILGNNRTESPDLGAYEFIPGEVLNK